MTLVDRLQDAGTGGKVAAVLGAIAQAALGDVFVWILGLLFISNLCDWIAGRWAARAERRFSKTESRHGVLRKSIAIAVVMIVRLVELILTRFGAEVGIPSTGGLLAAAITAWLVFEDLESIERHRMALGSGPIPLLSSALAKLRELTTGDRRTEPRPEEATES